MTEEMKTAYLDKMKAELQILAGKVEVVKARFAKKNANLRIDYHTQIEAWTAMESNFNKKLDEVLSSGADTYETVKTGVQKAWDELKHFVGETFEKSPEESVPTKTL